MAPVVSVIPPEAELGGRMRLVRSLSIVAVVFGLGAGVAPGAGAVTSVPASPVAGHSGGGGAASQSAAPQRAPQAAALQRAVDSGSPVVVDELTTPTELTTALPDGRMRRELSTRPVRVQQGDAWVPVDTDLVAEGDWWVPAASAAQVRFSPGGSALMAQTRTASGEWVSESSKFGTLPAPVVQGDTATYQEVMPGVDLKLVATKTGMASIYVVKSPEAAKSSGLASLQIAIDGAELTSPGQGRVAATADDGSSLIAAQPLWWDSSGGGTYREPGEEAPPAPVSHRLAEDQLTMDVGSSVAQAETGNAKDLVYPLFVDPDWSTGMSDSWYTDAAYPNASYLTAGASDVLRVGNYAPYRSDMFFEFPLDLEGSDVLDAVLNTTQVATAACPPGWISSHYVTIFTPGYTWNQEQAWKQSGDMWWSGTIESQQGAGCGAGPTPLGWTMTDEVAAIVDTGAEWVHFGFTGEDGMSRKHFSRDATWCRFSGQSISNSSTPGGKIMVEGEMQEYLAFKAFSEPTAGLGGSPFVQRCWLDGPATQMEIDHAFLGRVAPPDLVRMWLTCRQSRLFEDIEYGQWGLRMLSPGDAVRRTIDERQRRSSCYLDSDIVIGEFLGDSELLVFSSTSENAPIMISLPLDPRNDWPAPAASLSAFFRRYLEALGEKYWESE